MGQLIAGLHTGQDDGTGGVGETYLKGSSIFSFSLVRSFLETVPAKASVLETLSC